MGTATRRAIEKTWLTANNAKKNRVGSELKAMIYASGMRHAVLLPLQSNPDMLPDQAQKVAENPYTSTKGKNMHRTDFCGWKLWIGGTESFVFNKPEEIALSDQPRTPALGCGITAALSKEHLPAEFGSDYVMPRINWVQATCGFAEIKHLAQQASG
ncbi:hypothetical protein AZE42_06098 [Rhizopogon vesiculosus]|uniref:Uncharacterized protein n=1 Tax=Rhizopogon vesiculosus TaxID=180088 RepID=A0A1J8PIG6_9AGAM|nr:hypothetical protein AZE42_06098 [Rhizopogon vesiculosus]